MTHYTLVLAALTSIDVLTTLDLGICASVTAEAHMVLTRRHRGREHVARAIHDERTIQSSIQSGHDELTKTSRGAMCL